MSMLAERRRKQKYSTDPRGLHWANDDSKFGQKLMEKMGWQKGKGLGANEDGKIEHVAVTMKDDTRGVGCSKNCADNWIEHQQDFDSLLSQLNEYQNTTTETRLQNLEKKSKQTKARVHYKKFVKGKDLSYAKQDDLDSIFGKRKNDSDATTKADQTDIVNSGGKLMNGDSGTETDNTFGVTTVCSGTSVAEYFARKMLEMKSKAGERMKLNTLPVDGEHAVDDDGSGENKLVDSQLENVNGMQMNEMDEEEEGKCKSKKIKSKHKKRSRNTSPSTEPVTAAALDGEDVADGGRVSGKKKKKDSECSSMELNNASEVDDGKNSYHRKKSKKKRHSASLPEADIVQHEDEKSTERKKSRKRRASSLEAKHANGLDNGKEDGENCPGKKSKKDRHCSVVTEAGDLLDENMKSTETKRNSKKRYSSLDVENSYDLKNGNEDGEICNQQKTSVSFKEEGFLLGEKSTERKKKRKKRDSLELKSTSELHNGNGEDESHNQKKHRKDRHSVSVTEAVVVLDEDEKSTGENQPARRKHKKKSKQNEKTMVGKTGDDKSVCKEKKHRTKDCSLSSPDADCSTTLDEVTVGGSTVVARTKDCSVNDRHNGSHRKKKRSGEKVSIPSVSKVVTSLFPGCNLCDIPGYGSNS